MASRPWYAFYPKDYAADTAHLSFIEDAAYRRLIDYYYLCERALPKDVDRLLRVCRAQVPAEIDAVAYVLAEFFDLTPDGYVHHRIEQELERARILSERGTTAGLASATKRQQEANKTPTKVQPSQSQSHTQETSKEKETQPANKLALVVSLPDWLPLEAWSEFLKMRNSVKPSLTEHGKKLLIQKLTKLRDAGEDPAAILEASIENSWRGLFPVRKPASRSPPEKPWKPISILPQEVEQ